MLTAGQTIDRYKVEAVLGTGGTAVVYRVRHRQLNTLHALKVLSVTSHTIRERMIREGRVQAALRHLNVVAVTDVLDIEGAPGLLLEYIEGPSLEDALRNYKLTVEDGETLFLGILSGVRHAHASGLVHRDLKPANVLLARTEAGFVPKVTDFGLAKVLQGEGEGTGTTRNGIAMGTPHYMSPEQIRDARNVDQRADMFSLGCILYELVCGERTFPGDEAIAIYNAIIAGEYVPPKEVAPDLPDRLDIAIRGSLHADPKKRIPDCDTLFEVLRGDRPWAMDGSNSGRRSRPESIPPEKTQEVPKPTIALPVAAREPDGSTPPPAPEREETPMPRGRTGSSGGAGLGLGASEETSEIQIPLGMPRPVPVMEALDTNDSISRPKLPISPTELTISGEERPEDPHQRLSMWLVIGATTALLLGMLLIGGTATALVALGMTQPPPTRTVYIPPPEPPPPVAIAPATPAPPPPVEVAPTPPPPAPPAVAKAPPKPPARPAPRPSHPTETVLAPLVTPAAPPPAVTTMKILSVPPTASVTIDGEARSPTPLKLELPAGRHQVVVSSGTTSHSFKVDLKPGAENKWCYAFATETLHEGSCPH